MLSKPADQRHGTGDQTGDDRNQPFGAVVGDGEVFQALARRIRDRRLGVVAAGTVPLSASR